MRYLIVLLLAGCGPDPISDADACSKLTVATHPQTRFAYAVVYNQCMSERAR